MSGSRSGNWRNFRRSRPRPATPDGATPSVRPGLTEIRGLIAANPERDKPCGGRAVTSVFAPVIALLEGEIDPAANGLVIVTSDSG